jgi:hypothetical protein
MIPNLSKSGHSFKGAFEYHTHDKGRTDSADRVEWTSTRNLMTDDAKTAERVMIATALDADRLKERAGIKATGRKSTAHVQTLSLAWHPGENPTREEMERAADSALKALELEDHQAFISAHNDTAHKHLHIIINRVNPQDGRLATLSNSKRSLDRWAHDYEKERGRIVTPKRAEKYERHAEAREKYTLEERRSYVQQKRAEQTRTVKAEGWRAPNAWAAQAARQKAMSERHKHQWRDLLARQKAEFRADHADYRARVTEAQKRHDRDWSASATVRKEQWRELYREQRQHQQTRRRMERSPAGLFSLAVAAAREERRQGSQESLARLTWANLVSRTRREGVFKAVQERDRTALKERQQFAREKELEHLGNRRGQEVEQRHSQHVRERESLAREQAGERAAMQRAWDELRGGRSNARPGRPQDRGRPIDRQEEGRKSALAQLEKVRAAREAMEKPRMDRKEDRFAAAKSEIRDYQQQQESRTHQAADAKERLAKMREQRERPRPVDRQRSRGDDRDR